LKPVHQHRSRFATQLFKGQALASFVVLLLLIICILQMLGVEWLGLTAHWDKGSDLTEELRRSLVENDFDEEHNVFTDIANWEDWWNFAHFSLTPFLTATQAYQGLAYPGDLRVSPVLLRQVRTKPDADGQLPTWGSGPSRIREESAPLTTGMCVERGQDDASARDGCVWSSPPSSGTLSSYTYGKMYREYPAAGYVVELNKGNVVEKLEALQKGAWLDAATRFVSVEAMIYSKSRHRVAYLNLGVEVSATGWHEPVVTVVSFKPARFRLEHFVYLFLFAQRLGEEAIHLLHLGPKGYFASGANILNLILAVVVFAIFVCQSIIMDGMAGVNFSDPDPWLPAKGQFSMYYAVITTVQVQRVCAATALLMSVLKSLVHCVSLPVFGPIGTQSTKSNPCRAAPSALLCPCVACSPLCCSTEVDQCALTRLLPPHPCAYPCACTTQQFWAFSSCYASLSFPSSSSAIWLS